MLGAMVDTDVGEMAVFEEVDAGVHPHRMLSAKTRVSRLPDISTIPHQNDQRVSARGNDKKRGHES